MTPEDIDQLFFETVNKPDFTKNTHYNKKQVYDFRNRTHKLYQKIGVLYELGLIAIKKV